RPLVADPAAGSTGDGPPPGRAPGRVDRWAIGLGGRARLPSWGVVWKRAPGYGVPARHPVPIRRYAGADPSEEARQLWSRAAGRSSAAASLGAPRYGVPRSRSGRRAVARSPSNE